VTTLDPAGAAMVSPASGDKEFTGSKLETPHLEEAREFVRLLLIAEKNFHLYPIYGQVVQQSLDQLDKALQRFIDAGGDLRLQVSQTELRFEDELLHADEDKSRSIAFRLYKDGVRSVHFVGGIDRGELDGFLQCLKEARKADEDDDDFITLFWEKDCPHIIVQLADEMAVLEDLPGIPSEQKIRGLKQKRFRILLEEKEQLEEALAHRKADDGDARFELSDEEIRALLQLVKQEEEYFAIHDFVDILLELMVRNPDPQSFSKWITMIRTVIAALIEDRDYLHAAQIMEKFAKESHPELTPAHHLQLEQMLASFTDDQTLFLVRTFLQECPKLARNHAVFRLLKALPCQAVEKLCPLLSLAPHVAAISEVLAHLGVGRTEVFSRQLEVAETGVARALIGVILKTETREPLKHLARALKHRDENVRLHAAKVLLEQGGAAIGPLLLPLLAESSRQLLNIALQFFAKVNFAAAYEPLETLTRSRSFHSLDPKRQLLCFKALLQTCPERALEFIERSILAWTPFFWRTPQAVKLAGLSALASSPAPKGKEILERLARRRRGTLGAAARRALLEMQASEQRVRTAPGNADSKSKKQVEVEGA
jgi:hypothetical protein